ncbi:carboxylesterase/lipase family protein [Kineobactrum sediminis]|uniref:Carboxylic ester hydrolase n=1 Tax=Kineobactrum sediminis TaxID=1905677 RepID=A0A2N5Y3A0_9GAMM|nr:carboxylesterase/lipase family protein [Kineobactrum sediminis]PLW82871.1 carboxylesterase/lipase family protein [Kineobactrum sediminis]
MNKSFSQQSRRQFLRQSMQLGTVAMLGANGLWLPTHVAAQSSPSGIMEVDTGRIRGYCNEGVSVFKGIPYGASTAGENRFRPPQPAAPWTGVRTVKDYGPSAPQSLRPDGKLGEGQSEDCLAINVWTPEPNGNRKRPVMFWCHGGRFTSLSGSSPSYDGTNLCNRGDVVVVTVNHRLNILGFTHMAELGGESFAHAGTAGMLDLVAALEWVQRNIEQFGGDPDNVMIFGESGGGRKVGTLLAMPAAKGLFHRAVIQSGPTIRLASAEAGTQQAKSLFDELGLRPGDMGGVQRAPVERVIGAYQRLSLRGEFAPIVDGDALPDSPFHPSASTANPDVPVIVGANRTELTFWMRNDDAAFNMNERQVEERLQSVTGDLTREVIDVYRTAEPDASPSELYFLIASDHSYVVPCMVIAERRAALNAGLVRSYYLTWDTKTRGGRLMTPHALDIPFVFDNTHPQKTTYGFTTGTEKERSMADKISDSWIAFARSGNPDTGKLPDWPNYSGASRQTMVLDNVSKVIEDPIKSRREIMQRVLGLS